MRALVTGAGGFVGRWLVAHLQAAGDDVWTFDRAAGQPPQHLQGDVRDEDSVASAVSTAAPDAIYHLAGVAFGPDVRQDVAGAVHTTVRGTMNLMDAAGALSGRPVVLVAGSAEIYAARDEPLREEDRVAPANAYGYTKLAQEAVSLAYHHAGAVEVAVTRAFNHIGPGQRTEFVVSAFASQLAAIANGSVPPVMKVGNLAARRDFSDVRDVVAAYRLVAEGRVVGQPVNVASGTAIGIGEILQTLIAISGVNPSVEVDPARMRPGEVPTVIGDATRLRESTGWAPRVSLDRTLTDVWADAVSRAARERASDSARR